MAAQKQNSPHDECLAHSGLMARMTMLVWMVGTLLALAGYQTFFQASDLKGDIIRLESRVKALEQTVMSLQGRKP